MNDFGIDIRVDFENLTFDYGVGIVGPKIEIRKLEEIRKSLLDPNCQGKDNVYGIAMDVYEKEDYNDLVDRNLLFGIVTYAKGKLGDEPIRSQGHIHAISASCGSSTGELYEIWTGQAIIYMQEKGENDPGKCYAVIANPGDKVIVPPDWVHATISANPSQQLTFGAWCIRDYGFDYEAVRKHKGIAYFPTFDKKNNLIWSKNYNYKHTSELIIKTPRKYDEFQIDERPIYRQFKANKDKFLFIAKPQLVNWDNFEP